MRCLTVSAIAKRAAIAVVLITAAACQQSPVTPTATPSTSSSGRLGACPGSAASPGQQVLLQRLPAPDDLAFDNTGRLLFSDINTGSISALNADGSVTAVQAVRHAALLARGCRARKR